MDEQILISLKRKLEDISALGRHDAETQRNAVKEELQYYMLDFIYHHPEYSEWVMYGGSALRICHGLDRMSVDLDFETSHPVSDTFLATLKSDMESHFERTYGLKDALLTVKITTGRGLLLRFHISNALGISHPSNQIHVKIDLNHFVAPKTVVERRPINRDQLSFVIKTYNMAALMASKIAAILLRGQRGVGKAMYDEKGRDIYDLLWYMSKRVVPDLDYLAAKGVNAQTPRELFDRLTVQMNKVKDANLRQDLTPLFLNRTYIENWVGHWRESYFRLLEDYRIRTVTRLSHIDIRLDFSTDVYSFVYIYDTEEGGTVRFVFSLSDFWVDVRKGYLTTKVEDEVSAKVRFTSDGFSGTPTPNEILYQYATLFYQKIERYLKKTNHTVIGQVVSTKLIRMTADNLNQREEILLNKSALLSSELEDLLK